MRILHLVPTGVHPFSGVLGATVSLAIAQSRHGLHVTVGHVDDSPVTEPDHRARLEAEEVAIVRLGRARAVGGTESWEAVGDVLHLHGVFNVHNNLAAVRTSLPVVWSPHGGYAPEALDYRSVRKSLFATVVERPALRRAARLVALSEAEAKEIAAFLPGCEPVVIPHGIDLHEGERSPGLRREIGIEAGARLAVYAGRLDLRSKRLDLALRALTGNSRWHLALLGSDFRGGKGRIMRLAQELGTADRVHVVPPRRGGAFLDALASADLFVLLSRSEGLSMAMLEAMAAGTPAALSPEVERTLDVDAGGARWVVPGHDHAGLARLLGDLADLDLTPHREAARRVAASYPWKPVAARYEDLYAEVMAQA